MTALDKAVFERSCLVYGIKPEFIETVFALGVEVEFRSNEEIVHHRATDADLYVVLEGSVKLITDDGDKLFDVGPGSVFGEIAFLDAGPRDVNAVSITHVSVLKFPATALRRAMCSNKELGFGILANLSRLLCARLRNAEDRLDSLMDCAHEMWNTADR